MKNINTEGIDEDNDEVGYNRLYSEEHCLNLNVFAPKDHVVKALHLIPVMVFIYGGGFRDGSNTMVLYGTNKEIYSRLFIEWDLGE